MMSMYNRIIKDSPCAKLGLNQAINFWSAIVHGNIDLNYYTVVCSAGVTASSLGVALA